MSTKLLRYIEDLETFFTSRHGEDIPAEVFIDEDKDGNVIANIVVTAEDENFVNLKQLNVIVLPESARNRGENGVNNVAQRFDELREIVFNGDF